MKKLLIVSVVSMFAFVNTAFSSSSAEVKTALFAARETLFTMLKNADKRGPEQQKQVKETADKVTKLINELTVTGKDAQISEMKKIWADFTKVRDEKVVPYILSGKMQEAESLANGEQKTKFMNVLKLCDEIK